MNTLSAPRREFNLTNDFRLVSCSGNVQGVRPYEVGSPSCQSYGMSPSSRYSGLCASTSTFYTPQNNIITQNTYTFKSERVNPVKYQTYRTNSAGAYTAPLSAEQAYQQALANYNQPHSTYEEAQQSYNTVLAAYNAAYSTPKQSSYYSRSPSYSPYFGKKKK